MQNDKYMQNHQYMQNNLYIWVVLQFKIQMFGNIHNQPSLTIRNKRQLLRADVRRQQLQQIFAFKRNQIVLSNLKTQNLAKYNELNDKINNLSTHLDEIQNVQEEMEQFFRHYPQQINNFVLIGNYIIQLPHRFDRFEYLIFRRQNIQQHPDQFYCWCFGVYLQNMSLIIPQRNYTEQLFLKFEKTDLFLSLILTHNINNFQLSSKYMNNLSLLLVEISALMHTWNYENILPIQTLKVVFLNYYQIYLKISNQKSCPSRDLKIKMTTLLVQIVGQLKKKDFFDNKNLIQKKSNTFVQDDINSPLGYEYVDKLLKSAGLIIYDNIKNSSQQRSNCIQCLSILSSRYPIPTGQIIFTKQILSEILYLMLNHQHHTTELILSSFLNILNDLSSNKIQDLLDCNFETNIVDCLKKFLSLSFNDRQHSKCLILTLELIHRFLRRLNYQDQSHMKRILDRMCTAGFDSAISNMAMSNQRYSQQIQNLYGEMIDLYFSEDCSQQLELY